MLHRYYNQEDMSHERLQKLAGFQIKILRAALTKYPDVKRVVYSTCSILPEENEDVVRQVIETNYYFKLVPAKQFISGGWKNFGSPDYGELGACCLYTKPEEDFTNGFFVAVFERLAEGEQNKFFNNKIYSYKRSIDKKERKQAKRLERQQRENEEKDIADIDVADDVETEINDNLLEDKSKDISEKDKKHKKNKKKSVMGSEVCNNSPDIILEGSVDVLINHTVNNHSECAQENVIYKKGKKKKHKDTMVIDLVDDQELDIVQNNKFKGKVGGSNDDMNIDMHDSVDISEDRPKKKKKKSHKEPAMENCVDENFFAEAVVEEVRSKKKKTRIDKVYDSPEVILQETNVKNDSEVTQGIMVHKKSTKKKHNDTKEINFENETAVKDKRTKKKEKYTHVESEDLIVNDDGFASEEKIKKKKKRKLENIIDLEENIESLKNVEKNIDVTIFKKKKKRSTDLEK